MAAPATQIVILPPGQNPNNLLSFIMRTEIKLLPCGENGKRLLLSDVTPSGVSEMLKQEQIRAMKVANIIRLRGGYASPPPETSEEKPSAPWF